MITAISGPVTITLNAGNPETAPQGGYVISFTSPISAATAITIAGNGRIQYSAILKVGPLAEKSSITAYPNPLKDKILSIQFVNQAAGLYKLQIFNEPGRLVYSGSIELDGSNITRSIIPGNIAKGNYFLKIYSAKGKMTVLQVFFN